MKKTLLALFTGVLLGTLTGFPLASAASGDLALSAGNVWFSTESYLEGSTIRIWASAQNNSPSDLLGSVRFSVDGSLIDSDQPISALAGKTDEVFVDWVPGTYGTFTLTIQVIPWDSSSDNPDNNTVHKEVTVYQDTDRDGIPNGSDSDKDGDGVANEEDAFPITYSESKDTDGDGQGNNADLDDDNDGTPDSEDQLPEDSRYTEDQDGDGLADEVDEDQDGDGLLNEEESSVGTDEAKQDTDEDGSMDGQDTFPTDASEWQDTDADSIGDNSDSYIDGDEIENESDLDPYNPAPSAEVEQDVFIAGLGEEIFFDGSASEDDSIISQFVWLFGGSDSEEDSVGLASDGEEAESEASVPSTKTGPRVSHVFTTTGLQTATLTVYDSNGQSDTVEIKVRVLDYDFLIKAALFSLLLLLLAFYLIYRYTRARLSKKNHEDRRSSKVLRRRKNSVR